MAVCKKYIEILLSSGEKNHVDMYVAMNIVKENQSNIL